MSKFFKQGDTYTNGEFIIHESKQIGKGAYGAVYDCTKVNAKDILCAKIIRSQGSDSNYMSRETDIINTLRQAYPNNQNLVKVYYCQYQTFENQEILIIVMEKCLTNLKDELAKKGSFTSDEVINILKQLLNGYKPLYEKAILHRDIKPENILISNDFQGKPIYKLADFGIGKVCKNNDITMTKVGTPVYAAPELNTFINDETLDQAILQLKKIPNGKSQVDVYSIGIMLYQLLFGQPPFETKYGDSIKVFINNLKNTSFKIQDKSKNINSDLQELIQGMIVYNPMTRIKFHEIYSNKLICMQTQEPKKFDQFRKTLNPDLNAGVKFTPKQVGPTTFQNQSLRSTNPSPNATQFQPNFTMNQEGPKPNGAPRFASYIPNSTSSDNTKSVGFQQSTPILQQPQIKQIQIDDINDPQNYLKTQLSENSLLYSKYTENLFRQSLDSIQVFSQEKIQNNSIKLMECFQFDEKGNYSLAFLKFYYCLIMRANKQQMIKKQFISEQELQQEIANILAKNPQKM
ncbi:unnamed protein product (macronuclear) [Paramecium tetraurelia]|uniref:Chromosome undetermined scaffold_1, whole genome shotgun sequence n=1 Tax=Paramecium tetraurelia TaxID=5888 RepID=Q6BFY7_PARTE|nr:Protein kinase [Paramecium tetraurelia strain d4-2]XP_001423245.1 uncharacterized protein GSPATT00000282001 [Paramecium tetraurelia]CAH03433.1 Protein kinase, putative [Paramecium tetraurelia]CAK55847.1 unnamed protein product [Paramecium tetraurelia]|eukprot:XP_001423245.1 hypothetical protein (macronuclear) [Paramecium tetraurelia strain d4-2]